MSMHGVTYEHNNSHNQYQATKNWSLEQGTFWAEMKTKPQYQKHDGKFEEQRGDDLAEVSTAGEVDQVEVGAQEREEGD